MKKNVIATIAVLLLAFPLGACAVKKPGEVKKPVTVSQTLSPAAKNSLTLEQRVTAIEERNARVDARARAAKKQFSPAPKYDPNFKG